MDVRSTAVLIAMCVAVVSAQQAVRTFEVVSIRPNRSAERRSNIAVQPGGRVVWKNVTVHSLIGASHQRSGFDHREIIGGPEWLDSDRFDVIAQAPTGIALTNPELSSFVGATRIEAAS